jgi:hypothetical protein
MILFWGLKIIPLRGKIPTLRDHLMQDEGYGELAKLVSEKSGGP